MNSLARGGWVLCESSLKLPIPTPTTRTLHTHTSHNIQLGHPTQHLVTSVGWTPRGKREVVLREKDKQNNSNQQDALASMLCLSYVILTDSLQNLYPPLCLCASLLLIQYVSVLKPDYWVVLLMSLSRRPFRVPSNWMWLG